VKPALALFALFFAAPAATSQDIAWYRVVASDGSPLGYATRQSRRTSSGRETIATQNLLVESGGETSRIEEETRTDEDSSGRPARIVETSRIGRAWTRMETRIFAERAEIVRTTPADRRSAKVVLPAGTRFDAGVELLKRWRPGMKPLEFDNFNPGAMAVERIVIEAAPARADDPPGGYSVLRRRYEGLEMRSVARLRIDSSGGVASVAQPMFGTSVTIAPSDREAALKPHPPFRLLRSAMVPSPFRIPAGALQGHIRYRFAYRDGLVFQIPATGEQSVTAAGVEAVLDICAGCGPGLPSGPAARAEALKPTPWLQSDDPRLKAIAAPIARLSISDSRKMALLVEAARPYLERIDFVGHYSALETLKRRAGDCTEAAVLLAALGRSAGIPTRVASGMVYSRLAYHGVSNSFMPHSWTLAFVDGAWRSFDLALDSFDATHIALTVGDGDARSMLAAGQLASLLEWKEIKEVRVRPGT
jgi:transglutaminase-like putative cysteine protease